MKEELLATTEEAIYTAGLFDGEGTVSLMRTNRHQPYRFPTVSLTSTTYEFISFLKETFGGYIVNQKTYKTHHKQAWIWTVASNTALSFLAQIFPYLKDPEKKRRANLLLTQYKLITPANGHYTEGQKIAKEAFEVEFFHPSNTIETIP